ncbi:ESX-3 secretion system protein EccE3 [Mycobacterium simulans]|uniref:type VII secretion protein EccE n=1 Tax=Mycobacterium simulans TaxID=627089 RepID=UPI00199F45EF|nr:type VII secretion protein EccE [Mycobacterium simulans]SON60017.1 ESX-3 secretion system protein EccE3 [Mycobacterium simulans]
MRYSRRNIAWPGRGRTALTLLAVLPAAMACPWRSAREQCVLGAAVVVAVMLFGWWRGLHLTTIVRRRLVMIRRRPMVRRHRGCFLETGIDAKTTVLLCIRGLADDNILPLPLIASYLNRYGLRADKIRITNRCIATGVSRTWIALTVSAADNLAALLARSSAIPLEHAAQVAARRLADHLNELGWVVTLGGPDGIPPLAARSARETWSALRREIMQGAGDYVAAYRLDIDDALPNSLDAVRARPASETWIALEIACGRTGLTLAAACALRTDAAPGGAPPVPGLTPQHGNHAKATMALNPLSSERLDGHTDLPDDLLVRLRWPASSLRDGRQWRLHSAGGRTGSKPPLARPGQHAPFGVTQLTGQLRQAHPGGP